MPDDLDFGKIDSRVKMIEESTAMMRYRVLWAKYGALLDGTDRVEFPEHMKGTLIEANSARAWRAKRDFVAETASYPKYVTFVPFNPKGNVTAPDKDRGDTVERWDTLCLDRLDEGKRMTTQTHDYQVGVGGCVKLLEFDGEDESFPWSIRVLPFTIASFPIKHGGPYYPKYLAMRFNMLVGDAIEKYSGKQGYSRRNGALGNKGEKGSPKLRFVPLADPTSSWEAKQYTAGGTSDEDFAQELGFIRLYTDEMTYDICVDGDGKDGEIVWSTPNLCGGVPAVVVPGYANTTGGPGSEMQPILLEVYNVLQTFNLVRGAIMSSATPLADRPEMAIINCTPEQLEMLQKNGAAVYANEAAVQGGARFFATGGELTNWVEAPKETLLAILEGLTLELQDACDSLVQSTDTRLAAAATAEAWHSVSEAQNRLQSPMLSHDDGANAMLLKRLHAWIANPDGFGREYSLSAAEDTRRRKGAPMIKMGHGVSLSQSDAEWAAKGTVKVATRQETEEQIQRRKAQGQADYLAGVISFRQLLEITWLDVESQLEELLEDTTANILDSAVVTTMLARIFQSKLKLRAGIDIPITADMLNPALAPPPGQGQLPAPGGQQQMPMDGGMGNGNWQPAPEAAAVGGGVAY